MSHSDAMLVRCQAEIDEKQGFIDNIVEDAEKKQRDLTAQELEMIGRTRDRIAAVNAQIEPLRQAAELSQESRKRTEKIAQQLREARSQQENPVEYRTAGAYVLDRWRAGLGMEDAVNRLDLFHRAAAHQTTVDNPGLLPEQIMGPLVNWVDTTRPIVSVLGPRDLPSGAWSRPRVTQHTQVAKQDVAGVFEKVELASRKMLIEKVPVTASTYGGYVNVSRQDIDWTQPQIMDIIIGDLAGQYALQTEQVTADALDANSTAGATGLGTTPTAAEIAGALWAAAAEVYAVTAGAGRVVAVVAPDMLGLIGPLFAPVNPQNAQSTGFNAGAFSTGLAGSVSGIPVYVSAAIDDGVGYVLSTAAAEVYEDRGSPLQVVEPSVLGVQVAYFGYFAVLPMNDEAVIKITAA